MVSPLGAPNRRPLAYAPKVFEGNRSLRVFGPLDEALGDAMKEFVPGKGKRPDWSTRAQDIVGGLGKYLSWKIEGDQLSWVTKEEETRVGMSRLARQILMSTSVDIPKEELLQAYLDKDEVEKVWRIGKGALGLTGVKHTKRDRVVSYLLVCYVAYLLWVALRRRLREAKVKLSPEKAMMRMRRVEVVRFQVGGKEAYGIPRPVSQEARMHEKFGLARLLPTPLSGGRVSGQ